MKAGPLVASLLLAASLAVGCGDGEVPPTNQARIALDAPDEESRNSTIVIADSNWTRSRIQVGRARKYYARTETLLDSGLYVEFFDRSGAVTATLVADSARIDDRTMDMTAFGDVHVESNGGRQIVDTDMMIYDSKRQIIHSDTPVHMVDLDKQQDIRGVGFRSDLSLSDWRVYNVSGSFRAPQ